MTSFVVDESFKHCLLSLFFCINNPGVENAEPVFCKFLLLPETPVILFTSSLILSTLSLEACRDRFSNRTSNSYRKKNKYIKKKSKNKPAIVD